MNEKVQLQAKHLARLLDIIRNDDEGLDEDSQAFLAAIELHLAIQAPTAHHSYATRRRAIDAPVP